MATHLDLEEQEQLDALKHFWNQWGNLITWVLIAVLGAYAAWTAFASVLSGAVTWLNPGARARRVG